MSDEVTSSIARIIGVDGRIGGLGFLFTKRIILTCAHVVCRALGIDNFTTPMPNMELLVDFPYDATQKPVSATIFAWTPLGQAGTGDIAALLIDEHTPIRTTPARASRAKKSSGRPFKVFGYPRNNHVGTFANGELNGRTPIGTILLISNEGHRVQEGFSGSPVWDRELEVIIGIVSAVDQEESARAAYIIPVEHLLQVLQLEPEMVPVPSGEFWMNESGVEKKLRLQDFWISKTPITIEQYRYFAQATGRNWKGDFGIARDNHPACLTSSDDEVAYCEWLSDITGKRYRFPFEDEWVKAARGGIVLPNGTTNPLPKRNYPWGDEKPNVSLCKIGPRMVSLLRGGFPDTVVVGSHPKGISPYGCLDMIGNVSERCEIRNTKDANMKALRGGNWTEPPDRVGIMARSLVPHDMPGSYSSGLRIACEDYSF